MIVDVKNKSDEKKPGYYCAEVATAVLAGPPELVYCDDPPLLPYADWTRIYRLYPALNPHHAEPQQRARRGVNTAPPPRGGHLFTSPQPVGGPRASPKNERGLGPPHNQPTSTTQPTRTTSPSPPP